jgi:hypothetical protein
LQIEAWAAAAGSVVVARAAWETALPSALPDPDLAAVNNGAKRDESFLSKAAANVFLGNELLLNS